MSTKLSIIIVNYNGGRYLPDCLRSIRQRVTMEHEVIMVDNASTDGSCEYVQRQHPDVHVIANGTNAGFSVANNIGVRHSKAGLILLLNNDTLLLTSLEAAVHEFEQDDRLGALGCKIFYGDGKFQPSIGYEHTPLRMIFSWTGIGSFRAAPSIFKLVDNNETHYAKPRKAVPWVSGAFLMTRRVLWDRLGGLDERYFMYVEEADYCTRIYRAGYRIAYNPHVEIIHYCGSGKDSARKEAFIHTMNSYIIYARKFHGSWSELCIRAALSVVMALRGVSLYGVSFLSRHRQARNKARAYAAAVRQLLSK